MAIISVSHTEEQFFFIKLNCSSFFFNTNILMPIVGHHQHRYKPIPDWGNLNPSNFPVNDCHEMVLDAKGHIILLTNETKNNILIYNK